MAVISQFQQLMNGKKVVLVEGKPTFFRGVQLRVDRYRNNAFKENNALKELFVQSKEIGANVVQVVVTWKEIEAEEGKFDFTNLKFAIDQCKINHLRMEIVWFGGNVCGSGWFNFTPEWIFRDEERYWSMLDEEGKPVAENYVHPADGKKRTLCIENSVLLEREKRVVSAMMDFINAYDDANCVVGFQVENEPSIVQHNPSFNMTDRCHCSLCNSLFSEHSYSSAMDFSKHRLVRYLNEIAAVVKAKRKMITRVNWICCYWDVDEDVAYLKREAPNIDFAGYDNYGCSLAHEYELLVGDYSQYDNIPFISEAAGEEKNQRERIWGALAANAGGYEVYQLAPATEQEDNCILDEHFASRDCAGIQVKQAFSFLERFGSQLASRRAGHDIVYFNCGATTEQNCYIPGELEGHQVYFESRHGGIGCMFEDAGKLIFACDGKGTFHLDTIELAEVSEGYFDDKDLWRATNRSVRPDGKLLELEDQIVCVHVSGRE